MSELNLDPSNPDAFINQYHLPEDAGEHADSLRRILERIPLRWGRWISCSKGWYPLIIKLDNKLSELAPDYELHQVKEKFGTLRYYIGLPDLEAQCCIDIEATQPYPGAINPQFLNQDQNRTVQEQYELDKWFYDTLLKHYDTPEHEEGDKSLEPERERRSRLYREMGEIICEYEDLSAITCESCGQPGQTLFRNHWYRTLCPTCAEEQGYVPIPKDNE